MYMYMYIYIYVYMYICMIKTTMHLVWVQVS
jgi:hypothetical protein